jgi:glutaredoxin
MPTASLPRIRLYTAPGCGRCRQLKAHLQQLRLPFQELDISRNRRAHGDWQRLGARGVPVLLVGDKRLDGYDPERLLRDAGIATVTGARQTPGKRPAGRTR